MNDRMLLGACWLVYVGAIAASGGFTAYLAGWQHPLAWSAGGLFAGLMVLAWWGRTPAASPQAKPFDAVLTTLVHCLPLLLLAVVGNNTLGSHAARLDAQFSRTGPATPSGSQEGFTLADVYQSKLELPASTTLIGMTFVPSDADCARLPGGLTRAEVPLLLYRYEITCCAADAAPIFVVLTDLDPRTYPNDTWIRVTGRLTPPGGPAHMARITADSTAVIATPAEPYLSRRFARP